MEINLDEIIKCVVSPKEAEIIAKAAYKLAVNKLSKGKEI